MEGCVVAVGGGVVDARDVRIVTVMVVVVAALATTLTVTVVVW